MPLAYEVLGKYRDDERDWMQYCEDDRNNLFTCLSGELCKKKGRQT
jgi:hypothetical protein